MSEVKVNKISPRTNCGTVTLGDSGDTFTIPAGATITNNGTAAGFGATGAASWDTTVKTGDFTAVNGVGYFVNTTSGEIDVTLPAGSPGAVVAIKDYAGTFDTNKVTLIQNGSDKIGGSTINAILSTEGIAVTLIFIDSTQGWLVTDDGNQSVAVTNPFIIATGGTITTCGNCKIHTFTGPGTFCVSKIACVAANNEVSYLVVAGGGAGATKNTPGSSYAGGGGGAGGFREDKSPVTPYTASPLDGAGPITVTATNFPITVGAGGAATPYPVSSPFPRGGDGGVSTFSTITSAGGGGGGNGFADCSPSTRPGANGGSGGGAGAVNGYTGGTGNTPPTSPAQGTNGGPGTSGANTAAGGGGGATAAGSAGVGPSPSTVDGGDGGAGATTSITGSPVAYSGGGGGASGYPGGAGTAAGVGGTGGGATSNFNSSVATGSGTVNTGGGGAGAGTQFDNATAGTGGTGGSGIVVIRYKFQ